MPIANDIPHVIGAPSCKHHLRPHSSGRGALPGKQIGAGWCGLCFDYARTADFTSAVARPANTSGALRGLREHLDCPYPRQSVDRAEDHHFDFENPFRALDH
jgi:hypothetical protein